MLHLFRSQPGILFVPVVQYHKVIACTLVFIKTDFHYILPEIISSVDLIKRSTTAFPSLLNSFEIRLATIALKDKHWCPNTFPIPYIADVSISKLLMRWLPKTN